MLLFLTRFGENSKMVITGDITQSDIQNSKNGLQDAIERFENTEGFGIIKLEKTDIVRDPIVQTIVEKYENQKKDSPI